MDSLTVCIPNASNASHASPAQPSVPLALTPTACNCMSCATGAPGKRRSFGTTRCLTHTYVLDKAIKGDPLFNKEQLGKYASESPFITMKKPSSNQQADCDCISCFIGAKCLIWGYEPGELAFTKEQLGQYYRDTLLYEGHEHNAQLQNDYKEVFM